jgi:mannose-6-phosphate isomerase-like protein (cupin superfamily)
MKTRILALLLAGMTIQAAGQEPGGREPARRSLAECVKEFSADGIDSTAVGYQYWFVGKDFLDGRTIKMSVVRPHEATHAPHRHDEDEFFFVLEGTAELTLEGERRTVGPLTSFYCPPSSLHGIRNAGETDLKYLVIKKYPQNP